MSLPLHYYANTASESEVRERYTLLLDKLWRIKAYNRTLDPQTLDGKQHGVMADFGRKLGRDQFPREVRRTLHRTIHVLEVRLTEFADDRMAA